MDEDSEALSTIVYSVQCYITNNTSDGLAPHSPPTAHWYSIVTSSPNYAPPNTAGVEAGAFVAEKATWTGATAISVYDCPDGKQILVLLIMEPFSGINVSKARLPDSKEHTLVLSSTIEQGTVVSARSSLDDVTPGQNSAQP
ncbi:hypothetical protein O1611_g9021 [Lasiodiplodia mahajangana]|uniref:Uncharacterized protein n=1 Tax=Lasiodiplodia mahajangana TaxID=1108764 RepID=A0ACC2JB31_9PEZI|nr:hypothetical protein O1611_g9021 [Lasiodiplodia mahajangana]